MLKFHDTVYLDYAVHVDYITQGRQLTQLLAKELSSVSVEESRSKCIADLLAVIYETSECMLKLIEDGFIYQSNVILRWFVEISNLTVALSYDDKSFDDWMNSKSPRPKMSRDAIAKLTFEDAGARANDLGELYKNLCKVSHPGKDEIDCHHICMKHNSKNYNLGEVIEQELMTVLILEMRAIVAANHVRNEYCKDRDESLDDKIDILCKSVYELKMKSTAVE